MKEENNMIPAPEDLLGAEIDSYRLESILGIGSYGVVYLARHLIMDRIFAFKILQSEFSEDKDSVKEFFRESKTAAKLEHPNVVQAFQAGRSSDGLCYFVMEYVEGSSVEELRINAPELLTMKLLLELSIQLADALDYAWTTRKIIHRDIKPGNLLVRRSDNQLKLADLGLAGVGGGSDPDEIVATPLYMAPEIAAGLGSDHAVSDIYSFGIMFYELSAGKPPFQGSVEELQLAHLEKIPAPLLTANPDLDPELAGFIDTMLAKEPSERPQSWAEIREKFSLIKERLYPSRPLSTVSAKVSSLSPVSEEISHGEHYSKFTLAVLLIIAAFLIIAAVFIFF